MATIPDEPTNSTDGNDRFEYSPTKVMAGTAALLVVATLAIGGATVLDEGTTGAAPQATFGADYDASEQTLTITHREGDHLAASRVKVTLTQAEQGTGVSGGYLWDGEITPGDSITLYEISGQERVQIVWEGEQRSVLLWSWDGTDA